MKPKIHYFVDCPECNSEGEINEQKCSTCSGRGHIPARKLTDFTARKAWEKEYKKMAQESKSQS
jgi:DnaJ-class molecular chaperone